MSKPQRLHFTPDRTVSIDPMHEHQVATLIGPSFERPVKLHRPQQPITPSSPNKDDPNPITTTNTNALANTGNTLTDIQL